ncbi:GyrI-like domain-containing protein [Larkinella insperata]|uniref:GyrI-like domain-containing protein n=1 Tax=Larkinella insperata TaxID=332158 RepID=A0ABW3QME3_9BACT|nr:GyrI-like domain-containing protein [Larkinella insperata]
MQLKEAPSLTTLAFSTQTTLRGLNPFVRTVARQLYREAVRLDLEITGPIIWQYDGVDGNPETVFHLDIVLPIQATQGEPAEGLAFKELPGWKSASTEHLGRWENLAATYGSFMGALAQNGHPIGPLSREVYVNMDFEKPENTITQIYRQLF